MLVNRPTFKIATTYTLDLSLDGEDLEFTVLHDDDAMELVLTSGDIRLEIRRDDLKSLANCFGVQPQ